MSKYEAWAQEFGTNLSNLIQPRYQGGFRTPPGVVGINGSAPTNAPPSGGFSPAPAAGPAFQQSPAPPPPEDKGGKLTFQKMWQDGTDEEKGQFIEQFEKQGVDVEKVAGQVLAQDPEAREKWGDPEKLSKKDKAGLLMEWGLRMMQASTQNSLGGAFAEAGLGTLASKNAMIQQRKAEAQAAEQTGYDRSQDAAKLAVDRERAAASTMSAEASRQQAINSGRSKVKTGDLIEVDGRAFTVMDDGTLKDTGQPWSPGMDAASSAGKVSAVRDRYNLFKESIQKQYGAELPQEVQDTLEQRARDFAEGRGVDKTQQYKTSIMNALIKSIYESTIAAQERWTPEQITQEASRLADQALGLTQAEEDPYAQF